MKIRHPGRYLLLRTWIKYNAEVASFSPFDATGIAPPSQSLLMPLPRFNLEVGTRNPEVLPSVEESNVVTVRSSPSAHEDNWAAQKRIRLGPLADPYFPSYPDP